MKKTHTNMKNQNQYKIATLASACLIAVTTASAAVVITPGDSQTGGLTYAFEVMINGTGTSAQTGAVGAWSWQDQSLFTTGEDPVGWTHTSHWYAVTLMQPTELTFTMERDGTVGIPETTDFRPTDNLFPSVTVFAGVDNDLIPATAAQALGYGTTVPDDHHTYNNDGNVLWAEDLSYLDHIDNTSATSITRAWVLPAGSYSFVVGSNAPSEQSPPRQGYRASFTAVTVPEPSVIGLGALALALLGRRQRRSK
jgi:MYXO-CTERM domain-containing protein